MEALTTMEDALARPIERTSDVVIVQPNLRPGSGMAFAAPIENRAVLRLTTIAVTGLPPVADATRNAIEWRSAFAAEQKPGLTTSKG